MATGLEVQESLRQELLSFANTLADAAGEMALSYFASDFSMEVKADKSVVTEADKAIEKTLREKISAAYPTHGVIGEEFPTHNPEADFIWVLDPIDGTEEFANRVPTFGTIIGLHYKGGPLAGVIDQPTLQLRVSAAVGLGCFKNDQRVVLGESLAETTPAGLRLSTSTRKSFMATDEGALYDALHQAFPNTRGYHSCFSHVVTAFGGQDAHVEYSTKLWDISAAQVLIEEAGGAYHALGEWRGDDGLRRYQACFGRKEAVEQVLEVIKNMRGQ